MANAKLLGYLAGKPLLSALRICRARKSTQSKFSLMFLSLSHYCSRSHIRLQLLLEHMHTYTFLHNIPTCSGFSRRLVCRSSRPNLNSRITLILVNTCLRGTFHCQAEFWGGRVFNFPKANKTDYKPVS